MTLTADARFVTRPVPRFAAGALALGVHGLFALLLVFGVSWQTEPPAPVMVDLWEALPAVQPPRPVPPPPPPEPEPEPEAVEPPAPKPVVEEPPPKAPDIALEKKKAEAERLKARQEAEEKKQAEAARAEEAKKVREKQLAEQKKRELLRQMAEEDQMRVEEEARLARQAEVRTAAASKRQSEVASVVGQYRDMISAKVRGNTRLPANLTGNPEVRCLVMLLPTGEVKSVRVTKSSGNMAYDEAVVRAIEKSSPLPLPDDRDARAAFVPELSFVHRPK